MVNPLMPPGDRVDRYFGRTAEEFDALYNEGRGLRHWWNRLLRRALFERIRKRLQMEEKQSAKGKGQLRPYDAFFTKRTQTGQPGCTRTRRKKNRMKQQPRWQ